MTTPHRPPAADASPAWPGQWRLAKGEVRRGWSPTDIRAALKERGITFKQLALWNGAHAQNLASCLSWKTRYPKGNQIIADALGVSLHELWPHWYPPEGYRNLTASRTYPPEAFERILERVAGGEALRVICAEADQPSLQVVSNYRRKHADFDRRVRAAFGRREGVRVRPEEFDRVLARVAAGEDLLKVCAAPGMPSPPAFYEHTVRDASFGARYSSLQGGRRGRRVTAARKEALLEELRSGIHLSRARAMCWQTINKHRGLDPTFARHLSLIAPVRRSGNAFAHREVFVRALRQDEIYAIAMAAVPSGLPGFMADDIRSDIVVGLLTGTITPETAKKAAREAIREYNAMFSRRDLSMQAEFGDGLTLAGAISDGSFDAGESGIRVREAAW